MEKIGLRFFLEKGNLPEKTIFYINQGYLSYKDNKKIYYNDVFILGQITPLLNQPQNIEEYVPKEDEVKILRPKYDIKTGTVLGIESCLSYLTVRNDLPEQIFDYGNSKENCKILYSTHKMKIPNSFSTTIFGRHGIQYESGAFGETDSSNIFFFLPSTVDRIGKISKYLGSVDLNVTDINIDEFGQNFDPPKLDVKTTEREGVRQSVLKVLKKIAEYSSQNLKRNVD